MAIGPGTSREAASSTGAAPLGESTKTNRPHNGFNRSTNHSKMVAPAMGNRILGCSKPRRDPRPAAGMSAVQSVGSTIESRNAVAFSRVITLGTVTLDLQFPEDLPDFGLSDRRPRAAAPPRYKWKEFRRPRLPLPWRLECPLPRLPPPTNQLPADPICQLPIRKSQAPA